MSRYIPESVRRLVAERAGFKCEYCRLPEEICGFSFEIDHIISIKHGGDSDFNNLAYSCPICNGHKGSDVGTYVNGQLIRFFNPRIDDWFAHFAIEEGWINGLSPIGVATVGIFGFNDIEEVIQRQKLESIGRYP
ncbi:MAG: HNH endonuclease [Saprospiraceae bacterium]